MATDETLGEHYFTARDKDCKLIYHHKDDNESISVFENRDYRWLQFSPGDVQSAMKKSDLSKPCLPHLLRLLSALAFVQHPQKVVMAGLGGGDLIHFFNRFYPRAEITAVELNPDVVNTFNQYFHGHETRADIQLNDINLWLTQKAQSQADLFFLDIHSVSGTPAILLQPGFYEKIRQHLTESGVLACNFAVTDAQHAAQIIIAIRACFGNNVICLSVNKLMSIVVLAFNQNIKVSPRQLQQRLATLSENIDLDLSFLYENFINTNKHLFPLIDSPP